MTGGPAALVAYRLAGRLLGPAAPFLLARRARQGKEDPERLGERLGRPGLPRPEGALVWAHGASVGETGALLPLVETLTGRGLRVVVTSGTRSAAALLARRLPPGALHQYAPLDLPAAVDRFLDHWRPDLALFAESEIWPNLVLGLERRGVPLALVNGRLSARSAGRWARRPALARAVFGRLTLCLAQSATDAERLAGLGAPVVGRTGNLKFDRPPLPADPAAVERAAGALAGRPLWLAASTHPGEEDAAIDAHLRLAPRHPGLLTVIAPRHPDRGAALAASIAGAGLAVSRRSLEETIGPGTDLHLVDTLGDLGLFYRLAPFCFVGGSLADKGGQNPMEPARLGAPVLHGPSTANFAEVYEALDRAGGALLLPGPEALAPAVDRFLRDPGLVRDAARAALATAAAFGGALDRTLAALAPFLPSPGPGRPGS